MPDGQIDFDALEAEVAELLTVLQDRQPGMVTFHMLLSEHVDRIVKLSAPLHAYRPPSQSWLQAVRCWWSLRGA